MLSVSKHPKPSKKYPKGAVKASINTNNTISLLSLMDSGLVYLLDTLHGPTVMDTMKRREKNVHQEYKVYKGFVDYNAKMGGVDAFDALRTGYYAVEMHGRIARWTVRFVDSLFNFALTQSWVMPAITTLKIATLGATYSQRHYALHFCCTFG